MTIRKRENFPKKLLRIFLNQNKTLDIIIEKINHSINMGRYCIIKYCESKSKSDLSLFKVPANDGVKNKWCEYVESEGFKHAYHREKEFFVCELHFRPEDIKRHDNSVIKVTRVANSVPSLKIYYTDYEVIFI